MGRIVNSFSYSPTDDQLINEIEIEAKRQGLDKSKLIIELLKVWYKEIKESGNKTSEPLDLSSIGNIINRKDDENKTETETISENKPTPEAVKACLIYCSKLLNPIVRESKYGYELNDVLAMLDILRNTVQRGEQIDLTREEQRIRSTRL